jgi:hypothetical protein
MVAQGGGHDSESITHHDEALRRAERYSLPLPNIIALELAAHSASRRGAPAEAAALQTRAVALRTSCGLSPTAHETARSEQLLASDSAG